jgi:DMSO reductase anchor subunit
MNSDSLRLLLDFGLVILIWLVQLVIYPSFLYYLRDDLIRWHKKYTPRITFIVLPLMLGQLMLYGSILQEGKTFYSIGAFVLVLIAWLLTFTIFVPRHKEISGGTYSEKTLSQLVKFNWSRTFIWTLLFAWNLVENFAIDQY